MIARSAMPTVDDRRPVVSLPRLAGRLAVHWRRELVALAAACGVVAATIAGALGVGAAVDHGLLRLALARLGRIDSAVLGEDFFRAALATELAAGDADCRLVPAIVVEAAVETAVAGRPRGCRATVLACDDPAALGFPGSPPQVAADEIALNASLAAALDAGPGTPVVLRVAERSAAPADSPLGRRETRAAGRRMKVASVLPDDGIGAFALSAAQATRPLVVVDLATMQTLIGRGAVANVILAVPRAAGGDVAGALRARLAPTLEDHGLALEEVASEPRTVRLTSRRLILPAEVDRAAEEVLGPLGGRPSLVFLANAIATTGAAPTATIPYSTILGIDQARLPVGDLVDAGGAPLSAPGPDEIVIDRWMADDFVAQGRRVAVGDVLDVAYFLPETMHGRVEERHVQLRIAGVAEMRGAAVDRTLVPEVEGVSDEASIADWDPPFPYDPTRVRTTPPHDEDDRYWKAHGTTPKAFVSLATARKLAAGRFGSSTAWHVPAERVGDLATLRRALAARIRPEASGLRVVPLVAEAQAAARGSTPFGALFLALSSFIVGAGLLLEWLLFRLLVTARRREIGLLAAVGWPPRRLALLLTLVGLAAAVLGSTIGAVCGPLWATLMLDMLSRAWDTAVASGSRAAFGTAGDAAGPVLAACAASLLISLAALAAAAARSARARPLALLRGVDERPARRAPARRWIVAGSAVAAVALGCLGASGGPARAVVFFFLSATAALVGLVAAVHGRLTSRRAAIVANLPDLAARSLAAHRSRSLAVIAIVAIAEFLVVSLSAFTLRPPVDPSAKDSPTGGWTLLASFGAPVGLESAALLGKATVALVRSNGGDDASCANLYAPGRPTVLGVGPGFIARGGFSFAAHRPLPTGEANPWTLLDREPDAAGPIPAIIDQATAQWALKVGGVGSRFTVPDDDGDAVEYEVAGLLAPGILQGFVIVGERSFERVFPRRSGYALALVDGGHDAPPRDVARTAADVWADAGVAIEPALGRLARLSAVQNTFLSAFQTLGLLGLLLGTAGVAAVLSQGVLERLPHFGLLQAVGFPPGRVRRLVVLEAVILVGAGLAAGAVAGLIALVPTFVVGRAVLPVGWILVSCGLTLAAAAGAGVVAARRATNTLPHIARLVD